MMRKESSSLVVIAVVVLIVAVAIWFGGDWLMRGLAHLHGGHR